MVLIIGGLKQPPRLRRLRNGTFFFMAQPPLLRKGGEYCFTARSAADPIARVLHHRIAIPAGEIQRVAESLRRDLLPREEPQIDRALRYLADPA